MAAAVIAAVLFVVLKWWRLPSPQPRPDAADRTAPGAIVPDAVSAALFFIGLYLAMSVGAMVVQIASGNTAGADVDAAESSLRADSLLRIAGYVLGLPVVIAFVIVWRNRAARLSLQWPGDATPATPAKPLRPLLAILAGLGAFLLWWPLVNSVASLAGFIIELLTGSPPRALGHRTLIGLVEDASSWRWVMIALVIVGAPIFEEFAHRGMLQTAARSVLRNGWVAIIAVSAIFTLMHLTAAEPHSLPALFVLSLGFGWIYERTQSILAPIAMHVSFNTANIIAALLLAPAA